MLTLGIKKDKTRKCLYCESLCDGSGYLYCSYHSYMVNHAKHIAAGQRKRCASLGITKHFSFLEFLDIVDKANRRCVVCGATYIESTISADHIIPVSRGGTNSIENIRPVCLSCNCKKRNKT